MTVQAWGTAGSLPDDPTDIELGNPLTAGDEVADEVDPPVDEHLVHVPRGTLVPSEPASLPAWLTSTEAAREALGRVGRQVKVSTINGSVQAPRASVVGAWWAVRGLSRSVVAVGRWLDDEAMHPLRGEVTASDEKMALRMTAVRERRQKFRWSMLAGLFLAACMAVVQAWRVSPPLLVPLALVVVASLARVGRPEDRTLLSPGVQRRREIPVLTNERIAAAFGVLGIKGIDADIKEGRTHRWWTSTLAIRKDGKGHVVSMQMPPGVDAEGLVQHEQRLAGALQRPEDCVVIVPKPHVTPRDLTLHVFDKPMLAGDLGPGPLAAAKRTNWWDSIHLGRTRVGDVHKEPIKGGAWLVGGRPNYGKSSLCLLAAAHTALDPRAMLIVIELKGAPVYAAYKPICHRYVSGSPDTDPTVLDQARDVLEWLLEECGRRNRFLTSLVDRGLTAEKEVTEELSMKYDEFRPITVIFDEEHRQFDKFDNPKAEDDANLIGKDMKAVRSTAISIVGATQLAGSEAIPLVVAKAARMRACMSVLDYVSFQQIFGNVGKDGFATSGVAKFRQGAVLLRTEGGQPVKVKTFNHTPAVVQAIGKRALELRERVGALTGEAAGEQVALAEREDPAVLLRDLLVAIPDVGPSRSTRDAGVAWLHTLEEHLEPDRAAGWLTAELRQRGVKVDAQVNRRVDGEQVNRPGVRVAEIRRALEALEGVSDEP